MKETFFHEDDYGQIEILPINNMDFCLKQIGEIHAFSNEHRAGAGWGDMYIRSENPTILTDLNIKKEDIRTALGLYMIEYEQVYTGYSSHKELCPNTLAYGDKHSGRIFFTYDEYEKVTSIWCSDLLLEICKLPQQNKLLVVDWTWGFCAPLSNPDKIASHLSLKSAKIRENFEKWEVLKKSDQKNSKWRTFLVKTLSPLINQK